jgi:hypothetical protein
VNLINTMSFTAIDGYPITICPAGMVFIGVDNIT